MLTVILYRNSDFISIMRYHHVFLKYQISGKIVLHSWVNQKTEELWQDINLITKEHSSWKIIIIDGKSISCELNSAIVLDETIKEFISYLSGKATPAIPLGGLLPEEIWYLACRKKNTLLEKRTSGAKRLNDDAGFSGAMRSFLFEIEMRTEMEKEFDLFRLDCAILTLAINEIPCAILQSGYLYRLKLEIDRDEFADYVIYLDNHMKLIQERQELEWEDIENQKKKVVQFPIYKNVELKMEEGKEELIKKERPDEFDFKDIKNSENIRYKLDRGREWYRAQMYFPKGLLRGEAAKLQAYVDSLKGTDSFLCEAGKDRLEREKEEILSNMSAKLVEWQEQKKIDQDLNDLEDKLMYLAAQVMKRDERIWVMLILATIQAFIWLPLFFEKHIKMESFLSIFTKYNTIEAVFKYLCWFAIWGVVVVVGCSFYQWGVFHKLKYQYKKLLHNDIDNHQNNMLEYLNEMLEQIAVFRYCERVSAEQRKYWEDWNRRREFLKKHEALREKGSMMSQRLTQLLGVEEQKKQENSGVFTINFSEEPSEEEYYLISQNRKKYKVELNGEGVMLKAAFEFIKAITIEKMPGEFFTGDGEPLSEETPLEVRCDNGAN